MLSEAKDIFGTITAPSPLAKFGTVEGGGIGNFLNLIFKLIVIGAGVWALLNMLFAGYAFMSAADDPKKLTHAWGQVWQTILGLAITAGAFVIAALMGQIIFGDSTFIINPKIPTP